MSELRDALRARFADPAAFEQLLDAFVAFLDGTPTPAPPRGPRKKRGAEPRPDEYTSARSYENAHWKWRRSNGIEGGSAPKPAVPPVSWGDAPVSRSVSRTVSLETQRRSPTVSNGDELRLPPSPAETNSVSRLVSSGDGAVSSSVSRGDLETVSRGDLARASETLSLCISPENKENTVVVVSGDSDALARGDVSSGDRLPSPVSRRPSPETETRETRTGDNDNNSFARLSPEAESKRLLLGRESGGRITGVLVANRVEAFNTIVAALRGEYSDADWTAFAHAVKSGAAKKWWNGGFALPSLCNPADAKRTPCYGITRGLEEARKLRVHAPQLQPTAKTQAPGERPLSLDEMRSTIGALPWMKAGGT